MKKIVISFGDKSYYGSLKALKTTSIKYGADSVIVYTQEWLKNTSFWKENTNILIQRRGAGYWIWKPYIILETFKKLNDGDLVLYSDAAVMITNNLSPLWDLGNKHSIVLFHHGSKYKEEKILINKTWTKRDCFILMDADTSEFHNGRQISASYSVWKKDINTINFLNVWQNYLKDPRISTDQPNVLGENISGFRDHRHDQSILSILSQKYNLEKFRDPSQWGNNDFALYKNSPYTQLFNHHRMRLFG
jgi:hypothetical protein